MDIMCCPTCLRPYGKNEPCGSNDFAECARCVLKQEAKKALDVQDASNLSGVARSLGEVMSKLRRIPGCGNTNDLNRHPIVQLYVNKMASLSGGVDTDEFSQAYDQICRWAEGKM